MRHTAGNFIHPVVALLLLGTGCAPSRATAGVESPTPTAAPIAQSGVRRNAKTITREEIEAAREANLFLMIRKLQPQWFQQRAPSRDMRGLPNPVPSLDTRGEIVVYMDGTRLGGPEVLRTISSTGIALVRFLSGPEADTLFGRGHENGAIVVTTR